MYIQRTEENCKSVSEKFQKEVLGKWNWIK